MTTQVDNFKEHLKSDNQIVKAIGDFKKERIGYVEAEYGLNDMGDYVWHFSSFHKAKPFPKDPVLFIRVIKTFMEKVIPSDIEVDVLRSPESWDTTVISILARGFGKKWNFDEERAIGVIKPICERMTIEIDKIIPKRTNL